MPKILIADDHALVREGLKKILRDEIPGLVFGEAGTGREALEQCARTRWDLVILDIGLPALGGLDVLKRLAVGRRRSRVLVVSVHPECMYAKRVLRLSAMGYLNKQSLPQELVQAVRKILAGGRYISAATAEVLASDLGPRSDRLPHEGLSNREFEVLRLVASGLTTSEVAERLGLSPKTVSTYKTRIHDKLGLKSNSAIIAYCLHYSLVGESPT